jgi:non-specific serine/threonine protein kinase
VSLASRAGDPKHAARFLGASTALIQKAGIEPDQMEFDAGGYRMRDDLEAQLGSDEFAAQHNAGAGLSVDEMIADAMAYRPPDENVIREQADDPPAPLVDLSPRELEVLQHMANGLSNQQIADALFLSLRTVTTHVTRILDKLRVSSRTAAVSIAIRNGLV